jgi:hypothetical protein
MPIRRYMSPNKSPYSDRRSGPRIPISTDTPVYLETVFDGADVTLLVENLSTGGALLMCPEICESLQPGECLPDGVMTLPGGTAGVNVVVRWTFWPRAGVQFEGISTEAAEQIAEFLESLRCQIC